MSLRSILLRLLSKFYVITVEKRGASYLYTPAAVGPRPPTGHLRVVTTTVKVWSSAVALSSVWFSFTLDAVWVSERAASVCAVLLVCFFNTLKSVKCPSVERTSSLPITPLPATPLDSGQCAKHLWKRPHAFSLIGRPFRDVFFLLSPFLSEVKEYPPTSVM